MMSSDVPSALLRIDVTHAAQRLSLSLPAATATIADLRAELQRRLGVPREKQRLFFGAPVLKARRREERDSARLVDLIGGGGDGDAAAAPAIPLMLIGTAAAAPHVDEAAVAQLRRLVCTTVEEDNRWFRCSYGIGYARQTAFVCRTCVDKGLADAAHAVCYACAEVCHATHDVEEWGVRHFMRCDCCTSACWRNVSHDRPGPNSDEPHAEAQEEKKKDNEENDVDVETGPASGAPRRCRFIVDSATGLPPDAAIIPLNSRNRRPRRLRTWCYCEDEHPSDDPGCGGVVCMLCASCYWSVHLTRIHTAQYRYMPCYGEVYAGDIVAFRCRTCATLVCAPCRLRCHRDHDVDDTFVHPSREDGTDNGAPEGAHFSCGCRGCCAIAEAVPRDEDRCEDNGGDDENNESGLSAPVPAALALELMNCDAFMGVVCAHCMQENPWLTEGDPRRCHNGRLSGPQGPQGPQGGPQGPQGGPQGPQGPQRMPIVPCGLAPDAEVPAGHFPFHAMLLPIDAFAPGATCGCGPCREAFERFAPRAETTAAVTEMVVPLHNQCDHCGRAMRDEQAFMCQTCELQNERTFFVCSQCNTLRIQTQMPAPGIASTSTTVTANTPTIVPAHAMNATVTVENLDSVTSTNNIILNGDNNSESDAKQQGVNEVPRWDHPLTHVFLEDTYENLYELCGMQVVNSLDTASREYALENIDETSASLEGALRRTLGETPLVFDPEDVAQHHQERLQSLKRQRDADGAGNENGNEKRRKGEN